MKSNLLLTIDKHLCRIFENGKLAVMFSLLILRIPCFGLSLQTVYWNQVDGFKVFVLPLKICIL